MPQMRQKKTIHTATARSLRQLPSPSDFITWVNIFVGMVALGGFIMPNSILAAESKTVVSSDGVLNVVGKFSPKIEEVGMKLWELAEVAHHEYESAKYLKKVLKKQGFVLISDGTANVPTAFIAEYGKGEPILGIMLEYDALPGLGNEAVPYKKPTSNGITSGHGCGHNLIGAGALGSALALKDLMEKEKIKGTIRVYGAAAEENEGAKVYMAREGVFNDVDAMLHWHPLNIAMVANIKTTANSKIYIEFTGKTSHAGVAPWKGRSALDAVELFLHGVNLMREHVIPTCRIHYIINNGGLAPNVVPDKASVILMFRGESRKVVDEGVEWVKEIAKGAAIATQTKELAVNYYGVYDILPNNTFAQRMQKHLEYVGVPEFTKEEIKFATDLQKAAGIDEKGLSTKLSPMPKGTTVGGSSDVGDVSWITPTMGLTMPSSPIGVTVHTWMATASHGSSIGIKTAVSAAKVLALTGYDILTDPKFLKEIKADFHKSTEGFTYKSPINEKVKEPIAIPKEHRQFGTVLELKENFFKQVEDDSFLQQEK